MKWKTVTLAAAVSLLTMRSVQAVDWSRIFRVSGAAPTCSQPTCRDDYCPKPMPEWTETTCVGCDDYVSKREPRIPSPRGINRCGVVSDDYTRKCPPPLQCPPRADLKCARADTPCHRRRPPAADGCSQKPCQGCRDESHCE
ncbi:MAG: hypothetical protein ACQESR_22090 [Planctomycetota bacterium]